MNDNELKKNVICMTLGLFGFDLIFFLITFIICIYKKTDALGMLKYLFGILLGFVTASLMIIHMAYVLNKAVDYEPYTAQKYSARQSFFRIILFMISVILIAKFISEKTALMTAFSVFGIKAGVYLTPFLKSKLYKQR